MTLPDEQATLLLSELAALTGQTPRDALRLALEERLERVKRELEALRPTGQLSREQTEELFGY